MISFSVIIPAYNRAALIGQTLDSVASATDAQIIVVDDGSTDATRDVAAAYGDRVTLLRQQNRGPGAARNLGLSVATGEYVAFLDSDDVWFPWTIETYRRVIEQNRRPMFVVGKPHIFEGQSPPADRPDGDTAKSAGSSDERGSLHPDPLPADRNGEPEVNIFSDYYASGDQWRWYSASSFVMQREAFTAAGGFTDDWVNAEDADAAMRMGTAAGFVQITSPATFGYRRHAGSAMANLDRTLAGVTRLIDQESAGRFPGGPARARDRRRIITTYVRPLAVDLLARGETAAAWNLYRRTFGWHVGLRRGKFLAGFPAMGIRRAVFGSGSSAKTQSGQ